MRSLFHVVLGVSLVTMPGCAEQPGKKKEETKTESKSVDTKTGAVKTETKVETVTEKPKTVETDTKIDTKIVTPPAATAGATAPPAATAGAAAPPAATPSAPK